MLLRTVLEAPGLRLRLLAGEQALDRRVSGIFTTDLLDPHRYLSGGEIVLTGLMWRRKEQDSETFVSALVHAGVTALAAGDAAFGSVPPDLVAACKRHALPILEVPVDVSFAAITEHVMRAVGLGTTAAPESAESVAALFQTAANEYGLVGWLISPVGRVLAGAGALPGPGTAPWPALAAACLRGVELPGTVTVDGGAFSVFPVAGSAADRLAGWFLAFEGDSDDWDPGQREAARELTGLAAAYRTGHDQKRRARRRSADELVRHVVAWTGDSTGAQPSVAAELSRISAGAGAAAVVARLPGDASPRELSGVAPPPWLGARVALEEMLPGAAVGRHGDEFIAIAPCAQALKQIRAAVATLRMGLPELDLSLGVSVTSWEEGTDRRRDAAAAAAVAAAAGLAVPGACRALQRTIDRARQARRLAGLMGGGVHLVDSAEIGSHELLLTLVPEEARCAFRARVLGPVLAYDRRHGTELVHTLEVFLACSGSWTRAAGQMYVHVNSLRYRIRRIEELTGRDLGSLSDQAGFLLALSLGGGERAGRGR